MSDHDVSGPPSRYGSPAWRLAAAQAELNRPLPAGGLGAGFLVDPERAEQAARLLDEAVLDIRQALRDFKLGHVVAPAQDPVSLNLAVQMREMDRRAVVYVDTWAGHVEQAAAQIRAQIAAYRGVEAENAARLA
ncbi:MAG: PE domain-containing protein [Pseudonocardia sp.]